MALQSRLPGLPETAPGSELHDVFRDRIASRSLRLDAAQPRAVDLEALVVEALHAELHGVAGLLAGPYSEDNWRSKVRGEKPLSLGDLCRLATDPTREARAGALAAVSTLAAALGCRIETTSRSTAADLANAASEAAAEATGTLGDVARALQDGHVSGIEAAALRSRAAKLVQVAVALERVVLTPAAHTSDGGFATPRGGGQL